MRIHKVVGGLALVALFLISLPRPAAGQDQSGNIYGTVRNPAGQALPGVQITLLGMGAPQVATSNEAGEFRFLGLSPGEYKLKAELDGFVATNEPTVIVSVGRNSTLSLRLEPPSDDNTTATDTILVTGSPLLDERKIQIQTAIPLVELEKLPTSRDPWSLLGQQPGVLSDRISVGGSESGQQANFVSPGTASTNSVWAVDGVPITDVAALGSSSTYYNFDSFGEVQISSGGSDAAQSTGGVSVNLVTKRGTNEWRASGRYLLTDEQWQSAFSPEASDFAASGPWNGGNAQARFAQGNRSDQIEDYGVEGGGPLVRDRLWLWASYGVQDIHQLTVDDVPDTTKLESYAAKLSAQLTPKNELTGFYHLGEKVKLGRDAGPLRPQPTTWNQTGPTTIYKLEDTQLLGPDFYLNGMVSYVDGGFSFEPQGGGIGDRTFPNVVRRPDRVWQNSFLALETDRPQSQARLEGSAFGNLGTASHELRFGAAYRKAEVESFSTWPGLQLIGRADLALADDAPVYIGLSLTERNVSIENEYESLFLQDTMTLGQLTVNAGLRYDRQTGRNKPTQIAPAPIDAGGILVGGSFAGSGAGFAWEDITPRLGLTYALGAERKTLLRASYSRFADQLGSGLVSQINPSNSQTGVFVWFDDNNDLRLTADEVGPFIAFGGVDPRSPGFHSVSGVDSNFAAPTTDEVVLGIEHALAADFIVGLTATGRRYQDIADFERLVLDADAPAGAIGRPDRRSDYELGYRLRGTLPNGRAYDVPVYQLREGLTTNGGTWLENGDASSDYVAVSLSLQKRLANRWMLRSHLTWSDWTWNVPERENEDPTELLPGASRDGGAVLIGGATNSGPKGDVFINGNWSASLAGLYQVAPDRPWGFNVAAEISAREGYPVPYNISFDPGDAIGQRNVLVVDDVERFRNDDILVVNARVEKEFSLGDFGLTLSLDGFNLTNEATVLQRDSVIAGRSLNLATGEEQAVGSTSGDFVREVLNPRIFRLGARLSFR